MSSRALLAALAFAAACSNSAPEDLQSSQQPLISDKFHSHGTDGFVWLPPMVPAPADPGDFVDDVPATVRIDQITAAGATLRTLATFTATSGPKGARTRCLRRHERDDRNDDDDRDENGYYLARWDTDDEHLSPSARYRARVFVPGRHGPRELGFADLAVVRNERAFRGVDTDQFTPLLNGKVLRIKFRIGRAAVDADDDGVFDWKDNCPSLPNANQRDSMRNGTGDACRCVGVTCAALDACHAPGTCQAATGRCTTPNAPDGTSCGAPGTASSCEAGRCTAGPCATGLLDCDGQVANGCETPSNTANCGSCGAACSTGPNAAPLCDQGQCGLACAPGFANCGGAAASGCETDVRVDAANCGGCGLACAAQEQCVAGACTPVACGAGLADCNLSAADGCEVTLSSDVANCGACGSACAPAHAAGACTQGLCAIGSCLPSFADVDGSATNGCEVDLLTNPLHCGTIGRACTTAHGTAGCAGGACTIAACDPGFSDCDGLGSTGCEADLLSGNDSCGACGSTCALAGAQASCSAGTCTLASCLPGFADCDGVSANGCEVATTTDTANCGACGTTCFTGVFGSATCAQGTCGIACSAGHADCDMSATTGCEVSVVDDSANCGGCGVACAADEICSSGGCTAIVCDAGTAHCDGDTAHACETDVTSDPANCGTCGTTCTFPHAAAQCQAGTSGPECGFSVCDMHFGDCDGEAMNGCEADLQGDSAHCGSCETACANGSTCRAGRCLTTPIVVGITHGALVAGQSVTFVVTVTDPSRLVTSVQWDLGGLAASTPEATWANGVSIASTSRTFGQIGVYTITARILTSAGESLTATILAEVVSVGAMSVTTSSPRVFEDEEFSVFARIADPGLQVRAIRFELGGGLPPLSPVLSWESGFTTASTTTRFATRGTRTLRAIATTGCCGAIEGSASIKVVARPTFGLVTPPPEPAYTTREPFPLAFDFNDPDELVTAIVWSFPNGPPVTFPPVRPGRAEAAPRYIQAGSYPWTARLVYPGENLATISGVSIIFAIPTLDVAAPTTVVVDEPLELAGDVADPGHFFERPNAGCEWSITGAGLSASGTGVIGQATPTTTGTYDWSVTCQNATHGLALEQSGTVRVVSMPIVNALASAPVIAGKPATFVLTLDDPSQLVTSVRWTFDSEAGQDSSVIWANGVATATLSHAFVQAGVHTVAAQVSTSIGRFVTTSSTFLVASNTTMTVEANGPLAFVGESLVLTATLFDPDGRVNSVTWNLGDGRFVTSFDLTRLGAQVTATRSVTWSARASLTVRAIAALGCCETREATLPLRVVARPGAMSVRPVTASHLPDELVEFDVFFEDPDGLVTGVAWNFGDDSGLTNAPTAPGIGQVQHRYLFSGVVYPSARLVYPGANGATLSWALQIYDPPTLTVDAPTTAVVGETVVLMGSLTDPGNVLLMGAGGGCWWSLDGGMPEVTFQSGFTFVSANWQSVGPHTWEVHCQNGYHGLDLTANGVVQVVAP